MQRYDVCREFTSAKLLIKYERGTTAKMMQVLVLSEEMLKKWIGSEMVTQESILEAALVQIYHGSLQRQGRRLSQKCICEVVTQALAQLVPFAVPRRRSLSKCC